MAVGYTLDQPDLGTCSQSWRGSEVTMPDIEDASQDVESAVRDVESAVHRVEQAVKDRWSSIQWLGLIFIGMYLVSLPGKVWHAKWRYALAYEVTSDKVHISDMPHDCAFLAVPLGEKYCHYERAVSTLRWATSTAGHPIVSYDEGKTWSEFTPDTNIEVPKPSTVEEVYVSWEKKDD